MDNPYSAPPPTDAIAVGKPPSLAFTKIARMSWVLPLACLGCSVIANTALREVPMLGLIGGLVFLAGTIIGGGLALVSLAASLRYSGVLRHAIGGLITSALLGLLLIGSFVAVNAARDAARRARVQRNLDSLQEGIDRYKANAQP